MQALLVEDDRTLARHLCDFLTERGVTVDHVADGEEALRSARRGGYDVLLLDITLPGCDGFEVCRTLRGWSSVPVIMLTARAEEVDRLLGLGLGADDYVVKPFSPRELLARMQALVRRARGELQAQAAEVCVGVLRVDTGRRVVSIAGRTAQLTRAEYDLLLAFMRRREQVLTRDQLLTVVSGANDAVFDRAIDVQVSRLRQKLAALGAPPQIIRTVRGVGYMMDGKAGDP